MSKPIHALGLAFSLLCMATRVGAVDGVILINQATVLASGGFPYTITQPGSYRLSGNLVVTAASTSAIDITASNVTLDLNGFAILGPNALPPCTTGCAGISDNGSAPTAVTVRNGSLSGWTNGVDLSSCTACSVQQTILYNLCFSGITVANDAVVSGNVLSGYVSSSPCGPQHGAGITTGNNALIFGNNVQRFGPGGHTEDGGSAAGIQAGTNSTVSGNTSSGNVGNGINVGVNSTVVGNTASGNGYSGIYVVCPSNLVGNTAVGNFFNIYEALFTTGCTLFNNLAP